jgi:hypothetical protein
MRGNTKHILFFFLGILFTAISFAQTRDEQIKLIRKKFEIINKDTTLRKVTLENEEFLTNMTDGGGELTGFYKNKEIKKIYEWIGLSNGISIKEFYFDKGQLIFVYEKFDSFVFDDKKNEFDHTKTKTVFEGRYYFSNKKLISKSTKGDKSLAAQDESTGKGLLESADDNMRLLNKKSY